MRRGAVLFYAKGSASASEAGIRSPCRALVALWLLEFFWVTQFLQAVKAEPLRQLQTQARPCPEARPFLADSC